MATNTYFVITDDTTTATFADGSGGSSWFKVQDNWAARVSPLRRNHMGGRSPFEDVVEEVPIVIAGSNAPHVYANTETLNNLLVQSDRYARGEAVNPVYIGYSVKGGTVSSASSPFRALLLGRDGNAPMLELPNNFDGAGLAPRVLNASMRFVRRGQWLHPGASQSASTAGASDGYAVALSMGSGAGGYSPTKLARATSFDFGGSGVGNGLWALTDSPTAADLITVQAESSDGGAPGQITTVANANAVGGSVTRYTPTTTNTIVSGSLPIAGASAYSSYTNSSQVGIFACVYVASAALASSMYVRVNSAGLSAQDTRPVTIDPSTNATASWHFLGLANVRAEITSIYLNFTAGSAAGYIEVDQLLLFNPDKTQAIMFPHSWSGGKGAITISGSLSAGNLGTTLTGAANINTGLNSSPISYSGDDYVMSSASVVRTFIGNPGLSGASPNYTRQNTVHTVRVDRYPAYGTPR